MEQYDRETELEQECETALYASTKENCRAFLEDDADVIEGIIEENADLIQDWRFKYLQKRRLNKEELMLKAEFAHKVLEMIDRKLDDKAEEATKQELGIE